MGIEKIEKIYSFQSSKMKIFKSLFLVTPTVFGVTPGGDIATYFMINDGPIVESLNILYRDFGKSTQDFVKMDQYNLDSDEYLTRVDYGTCELQGKPVITDVKFFTSKDREFGPFGKCNSDWTPPDLHRPDSYLGPYSVDLNYERMLEQIVTVEANDGKPYVTEFADLGEFVSTTNDERVAWTHTGGNLDRYPWSNALDDNKYTAWFAAGTIAQRRANPDQKPDTVTATFKDLAQLKYMSFGFQWSDYFGGYFDGLCLYLKDGTETSPCITAKLRTDYSYGYFDKSVLPEGWTTERPIDSLKLVFAKERPAKISHLYFSYDKVDKCAVAGCEIGCSIVGDSAVCNCGDTPLTLDSSDKKCVDKCSLAGCDDSALCRNPLAVGEDAECFCDYGLQFDSFGRKCTSKTEAEKHCPTSDCWTYEMDEESGKKKCFMKKGQAARDSGCNMYLYCSPDIMDFRWNSAKLFGDNTVHNNDFESCPIETSVGDVGTTTPTDVDQMWKHAPASCDSTVTRETDLDGTDKILITKAFTFQAAEGTAEGMNVGSTIYLEAAATVTVEVRCQFMATQSATSDDIAIEAGQSAEGKLDAVGSWDGSFTIEFTDNAYETKKTDAAKFGEMHFVKVSWTVDSASPLTEKINWYVDDCTVSDVADDSLKVDVIKDQCFASVINAINTSPNMLSTSDFRFTFKSFAFTKAGNGNQKISCNINFCLKDNNECRSETNKENLICVAEEPEKWIYPK